METPTVTKIRRSCVVPGDLITTWDVHYGPGQSQYLVDAVEVFPSYSVFYHQSGTMAVLGDWVGLVHHVETPVDWLDKMIWHATDASGRYFDSYGMPARDRSSR